MEIKTYSRARAAKARAHAIVVAMYELPEGCYEIETQELTEGRFTAKVIVDFAVLSDTSLIDLLREDLTEAGFVLEVINNNNKVRYLSETSPALGPTKRVWTIADSMPGAARKEVIAACREAGIAVGTARTQYQKWYKAHKAG